ncbi:MAG: hypothetical protein IPN72_18250 [Saprospiraceae bacterium]|nr:hypothetical protein [Saprospiraceae bacterium]
MDSLESFQVIANDFLDNTLEQIFKYFGDLDPPKNEKLLNLFVNSSGNLRKVLMGHFKGSGDDLGRKLWGDLEVGGGEFVDFPGGMRMKG